MKVVPFPSIINPASVFSHLKNFSVHVNAWGVKNGEGMNRLSHNSSWNAHLITLNEQTAFLFCVTVLTAGVEEEEEAEVVAEVEEEVEEEEEVGG